MCGMMDKLQPSYHIFDSIDDVPIQALLDFNDRR